MGVANHDLKVWVYDSDWTADDLSAANDAGYVMDVIEPITITRVGTLITTVMNGAATVAFDRRVLTASDTGRVDALNAAGDGVITIPTTTAVGKIVYKDVRVNCDPGDQIIAQVTSAATSGAGRHFVEYISRDETPGNCSDMVASA
jgi:hypothetical protein